jgi:hypothetical protein
LGGKGSGQIAGVAFIPQAFHILGITGPPATTYVILPAKEAAEVMIRVARVWAHRSPSGPSFRRQPQQAVAEPPVPLPLRTGGPVRAGAPQAVIDHPQPPQPLEDTQPTRP